MGLYVLAFDIFDSYDSIACFAILPSVVNGFLAIAAISVSRLPAGDQQWDKSLECWDDDEIRVRGRVGYLRY